MGTDKRSSGASWRWGEKWHYRTPTRFLVRNNAVGVTGALAVSSDAAFVAQQQIGSNHRLVVTGCQDLWHKPNMASNLCNSDHVPLGNRSCHNSLADSSILADLQQCVLCIQRLCGLGWLPCCIRSMWWHLYRTTWCNNILFPLLVVAILPSLLYHRLQV